MDDEGSCKEMRMKRIQLMRRVEATPRAIAIVATLSLLLAGGAAGVYAAQSDSQQAEVALPEVSTIIDRYVEAIGGEELLRSLTSSHSTATFAIPAQGFEGEMEMFAAAPNNILVRTNLVGLGETATGFNGEIGWSIDPMMGPRLLQGKELDQIRDESDFYADLYAPESFIEMEVMGLEEFGDTSCYAVRLVRVSGLETTEFFEVETGLIRGMRGTQESVMGSINYTTYLSDYQEFGGPLVPTKMVQEFGMGQAAEITLEGVEYNTVSGEVFDLPMEIATLVGG
jgi:hypothetical protein